MPVLKPRIPDGSENETPQTEKQTKISQDQQPSQKAPSPALTPATVQRMASLDIPSMEQQATGAISNLMGGSSSSTASPQASGRVDLEQIAEDIFPLVKRLIEIETDRVSRKF